MEILESCMQKAIEQSEKPEKLQQAVDRIRAGVRLVSNMISAHPTEANIDDLSLLFTSKAWTANLEKLITNALRTDVHFLPPDEQEPEWSAVPVPSVVLFRYPLTAPIEILDVAGDLAQRNWNVALNEIASLHPIADAFGGERPLRRARLQDRFLADLMTRYLAVYIRLGSPDFSLDTVRDYATVLGGHR